MPLERFQMYVCCRNDGTGTGALIVRVLKEQKIRLIEIKTTKKTVKHLIKVNIKQHKKLSAELWMAQVLENAKQYAAKRIR